MSKIMYSQKWYLNYQYPLDYFELLYNYYSAAGNRTPLTYYHLDLSNSVCDKTILAGGSYQRFGELSGRRWKKINMLPVYNIEQVQLALTSDESGNNFNSNTSFFLPTIYQIQPHVHDFMIYEQIKERDDPYTAYTPMYEVNNVEKTSQAKLTFWKVQLEVSGNIKDQIEKQLSGNYTFVEYEKQIYPTSDAIFLQKMIVKNSKLNINSFFSDKCGLYLEKNISGE